MLNYILPPILIVVSVSILITFLFRKAAQIPADDFIAGQEKDVVEKNTAKIMTVIGQFGLKLLERIMHRSKLLSLKFHNISNSWFQMIREKRQREARKQEELLENNAQEINDYAEAKQIAARPMVAANVTLPQSRVMMKEKNKLEDALIRRIAINPKDIEAYERLGDYYLESNNFQDSLECFRQVLKLSPTHHKARLRIRRLERMK